MVLWVITNYLCGLLSYSPCVLIGSVFNEIIRNCFILLKGYGAQSAEEKQRLFKLMRNLNFNGESGSEPFTPTAQTSGVTASDGLYSPEFRGDFGAGLLDLHAMDDTELLSEVSFITGTHLSGMRLAMVQEMPVLFFHCLTPKGLKCITCMTTSYKFRFFTCLFL